MVSAHLLMSCEIALNYTCCPIAAASLLLFCILSNAFRPNTAIHWTRPAPCARHRRAWLVLGSTPRGHARSEFPARARSASSRKQLLGIELRKGRSDARARCVNVNTTDATTGATALLLPAQCVCRGSGCSCRHGRVENRQVHTQWERPGPLKE